MILGILSDTHDHAARTTAALRLLHEAGAQALVHCGDVMNPQVLALCTGQPLYFVFGNNDDEFELRSAARGMKDVHCLGYQGIIELAGKRIGVTHGHLRSELQTLITQAPDYLCSGHSHVAHDERVGGIRRINPGALYRARQYSVAVLDLATDALRFLPVA